MASYLDIKIRDLCAQIFKNIFIFAFFFSLFGFSESVLATHEADHRYVISGYVRDEVGATITSATVHLEHKGGEKTKVNTNRSGYYEFMFHLHNENLGDEILVRFGEIEKKVAVFFDVEDNVSIRGDSVSFGAEAQGVNLWVYLIGASLVILVFAFKGQFKKKKAIARREKRSRKKR